MFTGIIEEIGQIKSIYPVGNLTRITVSASLVTREIKRGGSIATNGVCLTAVDLGEDYFTAEIMEESLQRTTFAQMKPGTAVNLERALSLQGRLDGHLVQGHVDGVGIISHIKAVGDSVTYEITPPKKLLRQMVEKGSVTLDGVSLTLSKVTARTFEVSLIPTTRLDTTLSQRKVGDRLHIETDIIGKYMEKLLQCQETHIDLNFLSRCGF